MIKCPICGTDSFSTVCPTCGAHIDEFFSNQAQQTPQIQQVQQPLYANNQTHPIQPFSNPNGQQQTGQMYVNQQQFQQQIPYQNNQPVQPFQQKKSMPPWLIAVIVAIVVVGLCVAGGLAIHFSRINNEGHGTEITSEYATDQYESPSYSETTTEQNSTTTESTKASESAFFGNSGTGYYSFNSEYRWVDFKDTESSVENMTQYTNGSEIVTLRYIDATGYTADDIRRSADSSIDSITTETSWMANRTYEYDSYYARSSYSPSADGVQIIVVLYQSDATSNLEYFAIESPVGEMSKEEFFEMANRVFKSCTYVNGYAPDSFELIE